MLNCINNLEKHRELQIFLEKNNITLGELLNFLKQQDILKRLREGDLSL